MTDIARLKIELAEIEPSVFRHIEVSQTVRLDDLHLVIQAAMGWENDHLYEFHIGRTIIYGLPDPDWSDPNTQSARKATLADLLRHLKRDKIFHYIYDLGDNWRHVVKLEALVAVDPEHSYPRLITAQGCCPPEDCGGPWGYGHYLEAIADPDHDDHDSLLEWYGPEFDPNTVDENSIRKVLAKLAKSTRKKNRK